MLTPEFSLTPVRKKAPPPFEPHPLAFLVQPSFPVISPYQDNKTQLFIREKLGRLDEDQLLRCLEYSKEAFCAHHLNSITLIRQEISSPNCLSIRTWTWPNNIWRDSMMAALIYQVSSNQKEKRKKWKKSVNIISSYSGSASLLSQWCRALNILNVLWGKLLIQTFIGGLLCARCCSGNGDVAGITQTTISTLMSLYTSGWWQTSSLDKNTEC